MKKYIASLVSVFVLVSFLSFGSVQAATLTSAQINAITSLLQSFGASATVVANVTASLNGTSASQPTVCPAWGCNYQPTPIAPTPITTLTPAHINSINPTSVNPGDTVSVSGSGFSGYETVIINGNSIGATLLSANSLSFVVPANTPSGPYPIQILGKVVGANSDNAVTLTVAAPTTPITTTNTATSCTTQGTQMETASNGSGYIGCDIVANGTFDLADSYCQGQTTGRIATGLQPDLYGRANYYWTTLTGLNPQEQVNVFIKPTPTSAPIECTPSLNTNGQIVPITPIASTTTSGTLTFPVLTSDTPVSQYVIGGTSGSVIADFGFQAANTSETITGLSFGTNPTTSKAITSITVGGVTVPVVADITARVSNLNITIPVSNNITEVPVTVAYNTVGQNGVASNIPVQLGLDSIVISGNPTSPALRGGTYPVFSNSMTPVAGFPNIAIVTGSSGTLTSGENQIAQITVTAIGGPINLRQLPITISHLATAVTSGLTVDVNGTNTIAANSLFSGVGGALLNFTNGGYQIAAGQTVTFDVLANVTNIETSGNGDSLTTQLGSASSVLWDDVNGGATGLNENLNPNYSTTNSFTNSDGGGIVSAPVASTTPITATSTQTVAPKTTQVCSLQQTGTTAGIFGIRVPIISNVCKTVPVPAATSTANFGTALLGLSKDDLVGILQSLLGK